MRTLASYISRFLLILIFFSAVSLANAAAKPGGRLIVIRVANFGWNLAASLKIDGQTVANIVQGRRYDHRIPAGRHVLTISAVPNIQLSQPTSITVNVRPGGTYIFTALWDSDQIYLRPTTLSPATSRATGSLPATSYFAIVVASSGRTSCMPMHCDDAMVSRRETLRLLSRLDTTRDVDYFRHGGLPHHVVRHRLTREVAA